MINRTTAYEIVGNSDDIIATHAGPADNGKYYGCVTRGEGEGGQYEILFETPPMFDTTKAADDAMQTLIAAVTEWVENELRDPQNTSVNLLTGNEGPVIRQIVVATTAADY